MAATDEFVAHTAHEEIVRPRRKIEQDPQGASPLETMHGLGEPTTRSASGDVMPPAEIEEIDPV